MYLDDDGPPNSESGHNKLDKELVEGSTHVADDGHGGELSRAFCITKEQLISKGVWHDVVFYSCPSI